MSERLTKDYEASVGNEPFLVGILGRITCHGTGKVPPRFILEAFLDQVHQWFLLDEPWLLGIFLVPDFNAYQLQL